MGVKGNNITLQLGKSVNLIIAFSLLLGALSRIGMRIEKIIQNRVERISLNIGDNPSISTELKNDNNFVSTIIKTPTGTINPLQFISTDNVSWVISGTLLLKESLSSKSDSLLPVIDAIERDIIYALENINLIEP